MHGFLKGSLLIIFSYGCSPQPPQQDRNAQPDQGVQAELDSKENVVSTTKETPTLSKTEMGMISNGLINVSLLNSDIVVDLKYASDSNFLNQNIYGSLNHAYLEENTAKKLALAQYYLTSSYPNLRILVWDAARPVSSQRLMWNALAMPANEKGRFVSNPKNHSLHNYGCAVDVTLIDSNDRILDMGTAFDQFDTLAQPKFEWYCLQRKELSQEQYQHRQILRTTMKKAGFKTITSEWWHFNSCTREFARLHYTVIP